MPVNRRVPDRNIGGVAHRTCSLCGEPYPLTSEFFYNAPGRPFEGWCRECGIRRHRERRAERRAARVAGVTHDDRRFGVEIEFIGGGWEGRELIREMHSRGLRVGFEGYTHRIREGVWKVVTDGSVSAGYELVSPPLRGAAGHAAIKTATEALVAAGCRVNRTCGLHVHHEVRDLGIEAFKRLYRNWASSQHAIDGLVAASRRGNYYTRPLSRGDISQVENLRDLSRADDLRYLNRFRALNVSCFPRYGTAEVRQHQGTLNAKKILAWIEFGQAFIRHAVDNEDPIAFRDTGALLEALPLSPETTRYLRRRAEHFGYAVRNVEVGVS